jgi:hypothetical protein
VQSLRKSQSQSLEVPFYLKMEAESASETFLKKKHWTMDKVLKQDSSKCITPPSEPFRIHFQRSDANCWTVHSALGDVYIANILDITNFMKGT